MESCSDEEDADSEIDVLLKALDGIERCFVIDVDVESNQSLSMKRKSLDSPSPVGATPVPKKMCVRDPRLKKMGTSSALSSTAPSPLPQVAIRDNFSRADASQTSIPGSGKVFDDLSNHLSDRPAHTQNVSSLNTRWKRETLDKTSKVIPLDLDKINFDSVRAVLKSVAKVNELRQSPVMEGGGFVRTPVEELKAKPELMPLAPSAKLNDKVIDNVSRAKTTAVGTLGKPLSNVRDPRIRTMINQKNTVKCTGGCSVPILRTGDVKSTEQHLITNLPSLISNTCEKPAIDDELSNVATDETLKPPKSLVDEADKNKVVHAPIPCLPSEILTKIFIHVPSYHMKNVKRVCKLWYEASNVESLLMRQKFVCSGIYEITSIGRTLSNSPCKYLNLEFDGTDFIKEHKMPWKEIGSKIRSLHFVNCLLGPETMCDVIVNCTEMKHLSMTFRSPKLSTEHVLSLGLFKDLFKQEIKRRKLTVLDIHVHNTNGWWLTNAILSNLFLIYPNISQLGFTNHALDPVAEVSDLWSHSTLTFSPILNFISSRANAMTKLDLNVHTKGPRTPFAWPLIISSVKLTRLRELTIEVDLQQLSSVAVIEFCGAQTELVSISCKIKGSTNVFMSFFLVKLLKNCPRLRDLKVTIKDFFVSYEFFQSLVFSKLEALSISSASMILAYQITTELEWPTNEYLKSLKLSQNMGNNFKSLLITVFRKLRFIEMDNLSDTLAKSIQDLQTDLIALKVPRIECGPANGFLATPFRIRDMENLECLVLDIADSKQPLFEHMFAQLRLPKLKYLYLGFAVSPSAQMSLLNAIKNSTDLVAVRISFGFSSRSNWLQLNENWKKLRYLRIVDRKAQRFKAKEYLDYFTTSPDLQALIHEYQNAKQVGQKIEVTYYYDVLDKQVKLKNSETKYRITSEKDLRFVDWLWF